ncbi:TPA: Rz1-like lysis system protein LysC [Enterobacter asburiae]
MAQDILERTEAQLTGNGCPCVTRCRLKSSAPRINGDLNALLDESELGGGGLTNWT